MDYDFFTFFVFEDLLVKSLGKQTTVNHKSLVAQTQDIQKINDPDFQTVRKNKKKWEVQVATLIETEQIKKREFHLDFFAARSHLSARERNFG